MLKTIYIYIIITISVTIGCAPNRYIRNDNDIYSHKTNNYDFFEWSPNINERYRYMKDVDDSDYIKNRNNKNRYSIKSTQNKSPLFHLKKYKNKQNNNYQAKNNKINSIRSSDPKRTHHNKIKIIKYKVKRGDNLLKISKKYNISILKIINHNKIKNKNKIFAGMIIKIPINTGHIKNKKSNPVIKPKFGWPLKKVVSAKRDSEDGVKSIGIIITGKSRSSVVSSADGIVRKIGKMRGFGKYVILKHKNKYLTIYSNLKEINVNEGEWIKKGKWIGRIDGNKLHFQIGYSGKPMDPLIFLSKKS